MTSQAQLFIESKLEPLIREGRAIEKLRMFVPASSELLQLGYIETRFGRLQVKANAWLSKGCSYILGEACAGFCWVRRRKQEG